MPVKTRKWLKISLPIIFVSFVFIIGAGFYFNLSASSEETYQGLKLFSTVIEEIEKNYVEPVDSKKLIESAIQGMVHSLDPHSQFMSPEAFEDLQTGTRGEFEGLGIVITMPKGILQVVSPIEGTPAYRAGIKTGDIIAEIDGESTIDMELWEAVKKMRGKKGTTVELSIIRKNEPERLSFELTRDVIPLISIKSITIKPGYGYVWITNFQEHTTEDLTEALKQLKKENEGAPLKGLILDLRNNPGGLLDQAVSVSDMFIEEGAILSVKERNNEEVYYAHKNKVKRDYPIVALINGGSASASEILAGALQDHQRALILGTTSFGKGSVQTVKPLGDGYGIKFTVARYYTPNDRTIQAKGITPDITVEYRMIEKEKEETPDYLRLKEKDLKNHLEAKPKDDLDDSKEGSAEKGDEDKTENDLGQSKYGSLDAATLLTDSQVNRALDALISYEIFKKMGQNN